jgi:ABC-type transporter Mla subunit MlaD
LNDSETATKNLKDESGRLADTITSKVIPAIDKELEKVAAQTAAYAAQREELLALIAEYEAYIEALNKQVEVQSAGFDKDTDYSALMNEYLSKGGSTDDETFKELQRQREAKIAWLKTDEGGNKGPEYWGTSGQDTIDKYNRILAGGGTDEENAWFKANYVDDEKLTGIFEKLGVPIEEIQAKLDALKEATDGTNTKIDESKENIVSTVKESGEATNSKVDEAKTEINDAIKNAGDTSDTVVKDAGEKTDEVIKDTGEATDGVIEETGETTVSSLQDLADVISSESGDIQGAIDSAASTVASSVGGAISSIQGEISSLRSTVSGMAIGSVAGPVGAAVGGVIGSIIGSFDTGGYTGDWGPEGKLAVLHEKELVLNQGDTANLLTSISFLKDIVSVIDSQASMASMFSMSAMAGVASNSETLEQTVTIHAEFPNATNHSEIEEAFNNLVNRASQYANRK